MKYTTIQKVDGLEVRHNNYGVTEQELLEYVNYARKKFPNAQWNYLGIIFEDEEVQLEYNYVPVPFDRIRRITGYLVGTTDRWNDAKQAELRDRVKHGKV